MANPAEVYEQYFGPAIFAPSTKILLEIAAPLSGERVLDLACGTGRVTRELPALVGASGKVVGIDVNPGMLAVARALPGSEQIEWREGNAVALDVPDASFDLITIQHGFQFFPDKPAAAKHLRRALAPGGRLVLSTWRGLDAHPFMNTLFSAEAEVLGIPVEKMAMPFSFGDPAALRAVLADAGFTVDLVERTIEARFPHPEQYMMLSVMGASAVMPDVFANRDPKELVEQVSRAVAGELAKHVVGDHVVMPMTMNVATAR